VHFVKHGCLKFHNYQNDLSPQIDHASNLFSFQEIKLEWLTADWIDPHVEFLAAVFISYSLVRFLGSDIGTFAKLLTIVLKDYPTIFYPSYSVYGLAMGLCDRCARSSDLCEGQPSVHQMTGLFFQVFFVAVQPAII
jgi:hypothetical protein